MSKTMINLNVLDVNKTEFKSNFPKNPLKEKWNKLYPPTPMSQYSQVCDGYSCMWCGRCPKGDYWKVPEEDKEIWDKYQRQIYQYYKIHVQSITENGDKK